MAVGDANFMHDSAGRLVPVGLIKPQHLLEDQTVRKIIGFAQQLSDQISRFRGHTFDDVATFSELLAEQYQAKVGGAKGNITLSTYDGLSKVVVQIADQLAFGPELQVAKKLVDDCITTWSDGARTEIRALVEHAFQVDKEGQINRAALFQLRRLDIDDEHWRAAMTALGDAIRVVGSKQYVRFYRRANLAAKWEPITIDLAAA
ncbi:sulfate transporter [Rhodopseudomonas sp. AAP120]|nr:sulfate transporter [Rhodopseudomonas sp. AAP120]